MTVCQAPLSSKDNLLESTNSVCNVVAALRKNGLLILQPKDPQSFLRRCERMLRFVAFGSANGPLPDGISLEMWTTAVQRIRGEIERMQQHFPTDE